MSVWEAPTQGDDTPQRRWMRCGRCIASITSRGLREKYIMRGKGFLPYRWKNIARRER